MTNTEVTNNVFTAEETSTNESSTGQEAQPTVNELITGTVAEFVGEGKKFKTVEALAASYQHSQEFIETLMNEKKEIEAKLQKASNADEVFNKLLESKQEPKAETTPSGVSKEEIQELIKSTYTQEKSKEVADRNIKEANDKLVQHFGDFTKATDFIKQKSEELGLSTDFLMSTAAKSPTAFYNVVGINSTKAVENTPFVQSQSNSAATKTDAIKPNSKEYFAQLYKEDRKLYFSPKIQKAMLDAAANGTY